MSFSAWAGYFYAKKIFARNANEDPNYLTMDEWNTLLAEEGFNPGLLEEIDSLIMPTVEEVAEAAKRRSDSLTE